MNAVQGLGQLPASLCLPPVLLQEGAAGHLPRPRPMLSGSTTEYQVARSLSSPKVLPVWAGGPQTW